MSCEFGGDTFAEILLKVWTNDEDYFAEARANRIEDRVVKNGFTRRTHRVDLLKATVAAAHTSGEDEKGGLHLERAFKAVSDVLLQSFDETQGVFDDVEFGVIDQRSQVESPLE